MSTAPALAVRHVSKTFDATRALSDVSLSFASGKVTALLGENGSGKSTLVKILAGVHHPDPGERVVEIAGRAVTLPLTPIDAHRLGLRFLHQDLGLVDQLSVADNMALSFGFLSRSLGRVRRRAEQERAAAILERFEVRARPQDLIAALSPSERTMVAIARAFGADERRESSVVVLDEPTSALPADEVERVFSAIRRARDSGTATILVSHRLDEVVKIADDVAVLRDGRVVAEKPLSGLTTDQLIHLILGRAPEPGRAPTLAAAAERRDPVLSLRGLYGRRIAGIELDIHAGEVLGVAGLVGCGRSELARIIAGAQRPLAGSLAFAGVERPFFRDPHEAISHGIGSVPQDRRREGVLLDLSLRENLTLGDLRPIRRGAHISRARERAEAVRLITEFDIRPPKPEQPLRLFSGGNQQKAALARCLRLRPRLVVLDEPTQGIDIGAREEIGRLVRRLRDDGVAVVLASSDEDELLELADRVVVLDRGRLAETLHRADLDNDRLAVAVGTERRAE